jgi:hypothetical protein
MECVRLAPAESVFPKLPCCRCADPARFWDRIGGKTYCPGCVESVVTGQGQPIAERADHRRCAICHHAVTLRYLTFPLQSRRPVELDLCGEHLRALAARRLGPHAFGQLRRQVQRLGLDVSVIFLLHDAFYDEQGRALQPVDEWY